MIKQKAASCPKDYFHNISTINNIIFYTNMSLLQSCPKSRMSQSSQTFGPPVRLKYQDAGPNVRQMFITYISY